MNIEQPRHEPELVTARTLAELLAVEPETILRWAGRGIVPAVRISSRCIRFNPRAVHEALTERGGTRA